MQLDPEPRGQFLDGFLEGEVLDALEKVDHVATDLAAETVVEPLGRGDVEARAALLVERAKPLEAASARGSKGDVIADHLGDSRGITHPDDVVGADAACHGRESRWRLRRPTGA